MMVMNQKPYVIEVIAPSSHIGMDALTPSILCMEGHGYTVTLNPQIHERQHQSAGSLETRVDAIHGAFANPESDAILCAVGGNRALPLLDQLDYEAIAKAPKPFMGFSDATCLLNALSQHAGIPALHAPTLNRLHGLSSPCLSQFFDCLHQRPTRLPLDQATIIHPGEAEGRMIGGNLSVFQALLGTPYQPDTTGAILFFEDIGDELSRYDRMLAHIKLAGLFDRCAGVLFGDMSEAKDSGRKPFGMTVEDVVRDHCHQVKGPVIMNAPFGHRGDFYTLPFKRSCFVSRETVEITAS